MAYGVLRMIVLIRVSRYAGHIGIQHAICSRMRQFRHEELESALPQLCQLLISSSNESMALEEFIIDLCEESVNAALLYYFYDLSATPNTDQFRICSRIYNQIQHIIFSSFDNVRKEKIKANVLPVTVLSSLILASVAAPFLPIQFGPLAIAQARRPRQVEGILSEAGQSTPLIRSQSVPHSRRGSRAKQPVGQDEAELARARRSNPALSSMGSLDSSRPAGSQSRKRHDTTRYLLSTINSPLVEASISSTSLPDTINLSKKPTVSTPSINTALSPRLIGPIRRHTHLTPVISPSPLAPEQKTRLLRSNYFRSQTAFLTALMDIANRLVNVPKPVRLSALRAELALIAQDLPAEVDIPVICPATLQHDLPGKSKHHRIVRLNPAEATSLNSAERVPYLLMVEVLRDDFDFDPESEANQQLLSKLLTQKAPLRRRLFDITSSYTDSVNDQPIQDSQDSQTSPDSQDSSDSVMEPTNGDLGSASLDDLRSLDDENLPLRARSRFADDSNKVLLLSTSSGVRGRSSLTSYSTKTPSYTDASRISSPAGRRGISSGQRYHAPDQPDVSALATYMRTAAQMLAQLDHSGAKRPKVEVAAIKAKIIASMQALEEQSFLMDDPSKPPTLETILTRSEKDHVNGNFVFEEPLDSKVDSAINSEAGAARMENDQITGGVRSQADPGDPSAATFGEDWEAKKDRIRRSSPYGWMKQWDLVSVIVKTGADLRQEAFACQLIRVCAKIWEEARIPIWVKDMRILVTGVSSGLIETITNGVSLHSLKRSLTLASIAAGTNPRKRIATLKDHFVKAFGEPDTEAYTSALEAFVQSLAAYSIISYILQLKDRHNGNLLIDNVGHIIHIDFGFMLSNSPGSMGFEAAPFKLTYEYIEVLGGMTSPGFESFRALCKSAFLALRKEAERLITLVEITGRMLQMPCFINVGGQTAAHALRNRFNLHLNRNEAEAFVDELIQKSAGSYYTRLYDTFQYRTQGIY